MLDGVSHRPQSFSRLSGDPLLERHAARGTRVAGPDAEAGRVQRPLRVHAEVDHVAEDLDVALRLHEASHHAEGAEQLPACN